MAAPLCGTPSLFRRFQPRSPLTLPCKQMLLNVYSMLREEQPKESINSIIQRTAKLTGVSKTLVWKTKKESKENQGKPQPTRRSLFSAADSKTVVGCQDSFTLSAIRRKVHSFFQRNEPPTIKKILIQVNEDPDLPNFKKSTFNKVLHEIGFQFKRRSRDSALIDREDIQLCRRNYLRSIRQYRREKRTIYYLDETWVNAGHTVNFTWQDTKIKCSREAKSEGLTTGLQGPTGKGKRVIITHAGNENGFVNGAEEIFVGQKTGDYHEEMDGNHFETWFVQKLLPNIAKGSVIVMDNASYHSVKVEKIPNRGTRKAEIQEWLTSKGIDWSPDMIIRELLQLVDSVRHQFDDFRIDKLAREAGHKVLRLPPYHCELNPIEMVWGHVKNKVAKENHTFKFSDIPGLVKTALDLETPAVWRKSVLHVIEKEEPKFWEMDLLMDFHMDPFIITVNTGESDSDFSSQTENEEE